jgi:hypothetical protein
MASATDPDLPLRELGERFVQAVSGGRGDVARGRNLHVLYLLDALWSPSGPLCLQYRPTRDPAGFVAMLFDLVGDARYGYGLHLDASAAHARDVIAEVRRHVKGRLAAPWRSFIELLEESGLQNLADVTAATVVEALQRPAVSDLPAQIEERLQWMTPVQRRRFDVQRFIDALSLGQVLVLLRFEAGSPKLDRREQHPAGGDLRGLLRRNVDATWCRLLACADRDGTVAFLASWPFDVGALADGAEDEDFAVAYALATDAMPPGRLWPAPHPFVRDAERADFEALVGRGPDGATARRSARLRRWGVSGTLPGSVRALDERLDGAPGGEAFHAAGDWQSAVNDARDELEVARRHFVQRVADALRAEDAS